MGTPRKKPAKRRCKAQNKAGDPCGAAPLKGADYCLAHCDAETRDSTGFRADNGKGGRPRQPRLADVVRERFEAEIDEWLRVLIDARSADRGVVVGSGDDAALEIVPDHVVRLAAFREAADRGYGRPKQALEHSGADGGAIDARVEINDETREAIRELGRRRARARAK